MTFCLVQIDSETTTDHEHSSSPSDQRHYPLILVHVQEEPIHNSPVADLVVVVGRRVGTVKLHTLLREVGPVAARPVDGSTPPMPLHVRCSDPQRPYPPHLVLSLVDVVRWAGNWARRMGLGQYRVEMGSDVEHRMVDQGQIQRGDFEEDGPD